MIKKRRIKLDSDQLLLASVVGRLTETPRRLKNGVELKLKINNTQIQASIYHEHMIGEACAMQVGDWVHLRGSFLLNYYENRYHKLCYYVRIIVADMVVLGANADYYEWEDSSEDE